GGPPAVMAIGLVEDVGGACLDADGAADLDIVDIGVGDVEEARAIGLRVIDDMHLHAANAAVALRPSAESAERDGGRIDDAQHVAAVAAGGAVELACDAVEGLGEDGDGPDLAGIRDGRAGHRIGAEMTMMLAIGVPAGLEAAQAPGGADLGEDE